MYKGKQRDTCLALDLGGTKLLIGEVDASGQLLRSKQYLTGYLTQQEEMQVIFRALEDYITTVGWIDEKPKHMGIGMIGQVDNVNGNWLMIDPVRKATIPVVNLIKEKYGFDCKIENDVKAATLAEKEFGTGKEENDFIYINIGTGIAAGFMINGKLLRGWGNDSGEIGHMVVDIDSKVSCVCGRRGCIEAIASGQGMYKRFEMLQEQYPDSILCQLQQNRIINTNDIIKCAEKEDALAIKIADEAAAAIACVIMNLIRVTNPEKIVLGGGVMADGWMIDQIRQRVCTQQLASVKKGIVLSILDPRIAGIIGAAAVGFGYSEKY